MRLSSKSLALAAAALLAASAAGAESVKIGVIADVTGPTGANAVVEEVNGAKLAAEAINAAGGVLGRAIELIVEDSQESVAGAAAAFGRLAAVGEIVAFIGPSRSAFTHAIAPELSKVGKPMMFGGTDPKLTHLGNPWLLRGRPNDTYSAKTMADFGVNTLKRKKWAIVHVDDPYGTAGRDALTKELKLLGVEPVVTQGFARESQDDTPFILAAKNAGADVIASYLLSDNLVVLAKQLRQNDVNAAWIGSPTITSTAALRRAGADLNGTYGIVDFAAKANPVADAFAEKYQARYGIQADFVSAWAFDAINVLARGIADAGGTEPAKIRGAILAIRDYKGAEGTYTFDQNGDALRGYNVVINDNGRWAFEKHVEFQD